MSDKKTIFVTGATGHQGGAVARHLVKQGFSVTALTRNTNSAKALALKKLDIALVKGDLNNADTYREYLRDVKGIFSVQTFENGVKKEVQQGITLATLGRELGVEHFVYSSVFGADLNTGIPHWESKFNIENHIKQIGIPYTIVRPTSFYENFLIPQIKKGILKGDLVQPIERDTVQQYIATEDIGKAVAKIFSHKNEYVGRIIPLAAEQLSTLDVAEIFTKVLNKKMKYKKLPTIITRLFLGKDLFTMFKWINEKSVYPVEVIESTKKEFPDMISLESWIGTNFKM